MKKQALFHVLLPLLLGGFIYLAARPMSLTFVNYAPFEWTKSLPNWVVYNLPDGLWSYSLLSFTLLKGTPQYKRQKNCVSSPK
jgi:hypothetical protein